jgi:uncharacterized membrane protein YfcA
MLLNKDVFKPVQNAGIFFVAVAIFGFVFHKDSLNEPGFRWFIIIMTVWHLFTGLGILFKRIWGYYLLKFYLYVIVLGIPIGTWISMRSLKYIKENEIKRFFNSKSIEI